ncbi:unnamed protein product [Dicrocoelium dendriticum]|nr:unnamed protein product [Dicrocoelium dendriticum]
MDQYFRRLQRIQTRAAAAATSGIGLTVDRGHLKSDGFQESCRSRPPEALILPARIRFMLEDILDLRKNGWIPRRAGQRNETTKPRYLSDIRMEVFKTGESTRPLGCNGSVRHRPCPKGMS